MYYRKSDNGLDSNQGNNRSLGGGDFTSAFQQSTSFSLLESLFEINSNF